MYIFNKYEMTIWTLWLLVFGIKIITLHIVPSNYRYMYTVIGFKNQMS